MTQRGRKSAVSKLTVNEGAAPLEMPDYDKTCKELYDDIVSSVKADHFIKSDSHLLFLYCKILVKINEAEAVTDFTRLTRLAAQLAVRLRLCPSSRMRPEDVKAAPPSRPWETR
jgi:hypothetical protein